MTDTRTTDGANLAVEADHYVVLTSEQMAALLDGGQQLTQADLRVYLTLAREVAGRRRWYVIGGLPVIASIAQVSERAAWRAVAALVARGLLVKSKNKDKRGFDRENSYTLPRAPSPAKTVSAALPTMSGPALPPLAGRKALPATSGQDMEDHAKKDPPMSPAPRGRAAQNGKAFAGPAQDVGGGIGYSITLGVSKAALSPRYADVAQAFRVRWVSSYGDALETAPDDATILRYAIQANRVKESDLDLIFGSDQRVESVRYVIQDRDTERRHVDAYIRDAYDPAALRSAKIPKARRDMAARARTATVEACRATYAIDVAKAAFTDAAASASWTRNRQSSVVLPWFARALTEACDVAERQMVIS